MKRPLIRKMCVNKSRLKHIDTFAKIFRRAHMIEQEKTFTPFKSSTEKIIDRKNHRQSFSR